MKRLRKGNQQPNPASLPAITLDDKDNYKIRLFTDDKDTYSLSLDWNCHNSEIPSICINPQSKSASSIPHQSRSIKKKYVHKQYTKHNTSSLIASQRTHEDSPLFLSTPNTIPCTSPSECPILTKEEVSSDSLEDNPEGVPGAEHDFQDEHLDSPLILDTLNEVDSPIIDGDSVLIGRELSSLKNRVTNIEMRVQSMHSMISDIFEWVQAQKTSMVVETLPAVGASSVADTPTNGEASFIQISNTYSPSSHPITSSSLATPLSFSSYSTVLPGHHIAYKPILAEFPSEYEVMELKRRSNTRRNFAAKLALRIYSEEGLMLNNSSGKCPEGTIGKLDSTKMMLIKGLVFQHWPLLEAEGISQDDFWKQECMRAIDEKGRYLRFQKKSVYKRMLYKKRSGTVANVEHSHYGNLSIVPPGLFSGHGELLDTSHVGPNLPVSAYSITLDNTI